VRDLFVPSAHNQRGHAAAAEYLIGLAAEQKPGGTASAMRCHNNKIAILVFRRGDDAIRWPLILYVDAIAGYPVRLPALNGVVKNTVRCSRGEGLDA
jgi:hypothetical protein